MVGTEGECTCSTGLKIDHLCSTRTLQTYLSFRNTCRKASLPVSAFLSNLASFEEGLLLSQLYLDSLWIILETLDLSVSA